MTMNNWYVIPSDNDLLHYGILGMKWGIRRYQNPNGSLTAAGRKRYYSNNPFNKNIKKKLEPGVLEFKKKEEEYINKFNQAAKKYVEQREIYKKEADNFINKLNPLRLEGPEKTKDLNRIEDATTLGMRALDKMGHLNFGEDGQDLVKEKWARDWFLYEDQTIGLPFIADQINQGKTAKEIHKAFGEFDNIYNKYEKAFIDVDTIYSDIIEQNMDYGKVSSRYKEIIAQDYPISNDEIEFYLTNRYLIPNKFIETCEEVKKGE